jgi:hypothetical protein
MKLIVLLVAGYVVYRMYQSGGLCATFRNVPVVGAAICGRPTGSGPQGCGWCPQLVPNIAGGGEGGGGGGAF